MIRHHDPALPRSHRLLGPPFAGNPAGVCLLKRPLPDALLQRIATENNLAETACLLEEGETWRLRWFTPAVRWTSAATRRWPPPTSSGANCAPPAGLFAALGAEPREFLRARDGFCVFATEGEVAALRRGPQDPGDRPAAGVLCSRHIQVSSHSERCHDPAGRAAGPAPGEVFQASQGSGTALESPS